MPPVPDHAQLEIERANMRAAEAEEHARLVEHEARLARDETREFYYEQALHHAQVANGQAEARVDLANDQAISVCMEAERRAQSFAAQASGIELPSRPTT